MRRWKGQARGRFAAMLLPVLFGAGAALAQDPGGVTARDKHFLTEISEDSNFEIRTAQLALQKSVSGDVKQYATMILHDHTELKKQIRSTDQAAAVAPASPGSMTLAEHAEYDKLKLLSGDDFDKSYIKGLVQGNEDIQKDEKAEAGGSSVPAVKSLAQRSAELDTKHAAKAKQLAQAHNVQL